MDFYSTCRFIEFYDGKSKWRRMDIFEAKSLLEGIPKQDVFISPYTYECQEPTDGENFYGSPYFDIDSSDLAQSLSDTQQLVKQLQLRGVANDNIRINFSGSKGFHIAVPPWVFGAEPDRTYNKIVKALCTDVAVGAGLASVKAGGTFDSTVYSRRRVLRIPGSLHPKTGAVAFPMDVDTLLAAERAHDMLGYAKTIDPNLQPWHRFQPAEESYLPGPWLEARGTARLEEVMRADEGPTTLIPQGSEFPVCVNSILEGGVLKDGQRNQTAHAIGTALRGLGVPLGTALQVTEEWSSRIDPRTTTTKPRDIPRANASAVTSAYDNDHFFNCGYIKSCGAACAGSECPFVGGEKTEEPDDESNLISIRAVDFKQVGDSFEFDGMVSSFDTIARAITREVEVTCNQGADPACRSCPIYTGKKRTLTVPEHAALEAAYATAGRRGKIEAKGAGIPDACPGKRMEPTHEPMYNVQLQQVDEGEFVSINAMIYGTRPTQQGRYRFTAKKFLHPKTQTMMVLIKKAEVLEGDWQNVTLLADDMLRLSRFQPQGNEDLHRLFEAMATELESTCHPIRGRYLQSIAYMLLWFSVLEFTPDGKRKRRGTLNLGSVGDSCQGKTELFESIRRFLGLGSIINSKSTSFAGLVAGIDKGPEGKNVVRLGELCRMDGQLVGMDEYHGIPREDAVKLTDVIDSGIARITKIGGAVQASARGRLCFMANPINGHGHSVKLNVKQYPVEHLPHVMRTPEDTRRLDFVIMFHEDEVTAEQIYASGAQELEPHEIRWKREDLQLLCRWAWSLKDEHIDFTEAAWEQCKLRGLDITSRYSEAVPLLAKGDTPLKLARIACAVATLCFSTRDGKKLEVFPAHVDYAADFLDEIYTLPDMKFDEFSADKMVADFNPSDLSSAKLKLERYQFRYDLCRQVLLSRGPFTPTSISHLVADNQGRLIDDDDARMMLRIFSEEGWVESTGVYLRVTVKGIQAMKALVEDYKPFKQTGLEEYEGEDELVGNEPEKEDDGFFP